MKPVVCWFCAFLCWVLVTVVVSAAPHSGDAWHHDLSWSGGNQWQARFAIDIAERGIGPVLGYPVGIRIGENVGEIDLVGAAAEAVRVCDAYGVEMLFDLRLPNGGRLVEGAIPAGAVLTVPVTLEQADHQRLYVYFDNPSAYNPPDYLASAKLRATASDFPQIEIGAVERLPLQATSTAMPFLSQADCTWESRLPVTVVNTDRCMEQVIVQAPLTRLSILLRRGFNPQSLRVVDPETGDILPFLVASDHLFFLADIPAASIKRFYVYISRDAAIPEGEKLAYSDLVTHPHNLAANPSFEDGGEIPDAWTNSPTGVHKHERVSGGIVGSYFARTTVPASAPITWTGWRQQVAVESDANYLFMAYVRAIDVSQTARIHAHILEETESGIERRYWDGGPTLTGTTDWRLLGGVISVPPRASTVEMHLTMNSRGILDHDGVVMMRCVVGDAGEIETDPAVVPEGLAVWFENPLVKVFQDTPPIDTDCDREIEVYAARGEQEVLQLILRADRAMDLEVSIDAPTSSKASLPAPKLESIGYVPVLQPSGYHSSTAKDWERRVIKGSERTDGWLGWWPDYLVPVDGTVELAANRTQPLWVSFTVPKEAEPGVYTGRITITGDNEEQVVPFSLRVWHFALPDRPSLQAIYDLRSGPGWTIAQTAQERETWWRFMSERRVSADHILPDPQFQLIEGQVIMDTTEFDRAAEIYFDELHMAAAYFPKVFYTTGWAHPPRNFLGQPHGTKGYREAYQQAVKLFWEHVKTRGWADRMVLYVADEPHYQYPEVVKWLGDIIGMIREVDPAIPVYASTWGFVPEWEGVLSHWGIAQDGQFPFDVLERRLAAGDKVWFTTDGQMETNTPYNAVERLLPYYAFTYGVDGYEFWGISWYTYNPFEFGWHQFIEQSLIPGQPYWTRYPNGDGYLAYPGELLGLDGPLSSIRLEQAREGLEDYEIYAALQHLGELRPDLRGEIEPVLTAVRRLGRLPNAGGYRSTQLLPDPDALLETRQRAGELLERLLTSEPGGTISGSVVDSLGQTLAGIEISFTAGTTGETVTDLNGEWLLKSAKGFAVITPTRAGWAFDPPQIVAPVGATGVRFTATPPAPQVHVVGLKNAMTVRGKLELRLEVQLPEPPAQAELKSFTISIDNKLLYEGHELPDSLLVDTRQYADGRHTLTTTIETNYGTTARSDLHFTIGNWWRIVDELKPPLKGGWFGTFDLNQTVAESSGWEYATDRPDDFAEDQDRKVRRADTEEYLVWEAPNLQHFAATIYATPCELNRLLDLAVSEDGEHWHSIPFQSVVEQPMDTTMCVHQVSGTLDTDLTIEYFRLTLLAGVVPADEVQIGQVRLEGLTERK